MSIEEKSSLVNKVVLVRVSFGVLGNSKQVKNDILETDANKNLLRTSKQLLDSPELKALIKADAYVKQYVKHFCLPYDAGLYLLPIGFKNLIYDRLTKYDTDERPALVQAFIDAYPTLCQKAQQSGDGLGTLYNSGDYASIEYVKERFYFEYDFLQFAPPGAEQMAELTEEAKVKFNERVSQVTDHVTALMRQTLLDLVDHLKSALEPNADGKQKRIFASNITNIQEFIERFKTGDIAKITNDEELHKIVGNLSDLLHPNFSMDVLKEDEAFKKTFHQNLSEVSSNLVKITEVVSSRKFKNVE